MRPSARIYDQHVHSEFSPDSEEPLEQLVKQAIALGRQAVVTTDHFDLDCKYFKRDVVIDMPAYRAEVQRLSKLYPIPILTGIEIGFRSDLLAATQAFLKEHRFDIVLLSLHNNGKLDYAEPAFHELPAEERFTDYYTLIAKALEEMEEADYDVLAHLDYFVRYSPSRVDEQDYARHRDMLHDILSTIIRKDKALELNTTGLYRQGWIHPHAYILDMYIDLGGKLFSLGSDAHRAEHVERGFSEALQLLKDRGIREVASFKRRTLQMISID